MLSSYIKALKENTFLVLTLVLSLVLYSKLLFFGHISWDDPEMVFKNKDVHSFDLKAFFSESYVGNYLPFTMLLHALTWLVFENSDAGHHLVNLLLHLLNGVLVYKLVNQCFKSKNSAVLATLIFLLHPLQLESVAWISELKNVLSTSFFLASLLAYLRYFEEKKLKHYLLAISLFLAACLSKSSAVILPLSLIGLDVFLQKKFRLKFLANKFPFFMGSLLFGIINLKTQAADLFINYSHAFPYHERLGYAAYAVLKYIQMFLLPYNLSVLYPYPENKMAALLIGFTGLLVLGILCFLLYKRKKYDLLALIFLCITSLLLVLQFVPFGEVLYADRYMYIPLLFFSMLVLYIIQNVKWNLRYLFLILSLILGLVSYSRMSVWKNSVLLYSDILKKYPNSFVALNSLGAELMLRNEDAQALKFLERSVQVSPQNYKGHYNKGLLMLKTNKAGEAIKSFDEAIALYDYPKAYIGRASAYFMAQDIPKAMQDALYVLEKEPQQAKAYFILGNCYNSLNQLDTAISMYNKSIALQPDEGDFYFRRAIAYGKRQDFKQCLNDLDISLTLNTLNFEAYYWRGVAKINLKQNPCEDLRIAARNNIDPAVQAYNQICR